MGPKAMKAMKAMKAAKGAKGGKVMTATAAYQSVAETTGLKQKAVKGVVEAMVGVAADQLKNWHIQDCRCAELETEIEACNTCAQGREPFHERAVCFQSQASIQDSEGASDEEAQRDGELIMHAVRSTSLKNYLELYLVTVGGLARPW